jgi:hypothetical protein
MILIGFTIFSIIIATAYTTFETKQEFENNFEHADFILEKICSPNAVFTFEGNTISLQTFTSYESEEYIQRIQENYGSYDCSFAVKLSYDQNTHWIPSTHLSEKSQMNTYASSKQVSVKLNEVTAIPGKITVVFWKNDTIV